MNGRLHWMVRVVRRAGYTVDDHPEWVGAPVGLVWNEASSETGLAPMDLARMVALHFRLELADLPAVQSPALRLIPPEVARRFHILPLSEGYHHLIVATADPTDLDAEQAAAFASGRTIDFAIAPPVALREALEEHYAEPTAADALLLEPELLNDVQLVSARAEAPVREEEVHSEPVIRLTNLIMKEAIEAGASDVHIEPDDDGGVVRIRVDGVLRRHMSLPTAALIRVISRVKVMGDLDIADRIRPQDGRARIQAMGGAYDLRISTVPSRGAEKAVIRILDPGSAAGGLDQVKIPEPELSRMRRTATSPDGIVIVTGPTGSGKTTTLYALLQELATDQVNIMTVEDPIEYRLHGITQIQVETKRGVTFANTLRAILRQDPDIIFVGEIRDLETAEIAVQASMTGHLVLATLHTNDAPGAVQRLLDLGLDGPSIAGSLRGVLAQRLLRTTCTECAGAGCETCGGSGYRGRRPAVEFMTLDDGLARLAAREATHAELRDAALRAGMRGLRKSAEAMVADGVTTKAEVVRVLGEAVRRRREPAQADVPPTPDRTDSPPGEAALSRAHEPTANPGPPAQSAARDPRPPQARTTPPQATQPSTGQQRQATQPPAGPSVLVVDDDPVSRTLARSLLESSGAKVTEAADGMGAIQALAAGMHFDLCILDLNMPNVGGREVLTRLRQAEATEALPVIVLTGDNDQEAEIELMEAGADDYLRKPLDAGRFMARVSATLRRSRAMRASTGAA